MHAHDYIKGAFFVLGPRLRLRSLWKEAFVENVDQALPGKKQVVLIKVRTCYFAKDAVHLLGELRIRLGEEIVSLVVYLIEKIVNHVALGFIFLHYCFEDVPGVR